MFKCGRWIESDQDPVLSKHRQKIKFVQSLFPYESHIEVNGKILKCSEVELHTGQQTKSFGHITITLPLHEFEFESDSSIMFIEWNNMLFKRAE